MIHRPSLASERVTVAAVVVTVWIMSLMVRIVRPSTATAFTGLDSVALLVLGYLFTSTSMRRRNGNGGQS